VTVGQEQETYSRLRDEQRLREDERMRHEGTAGARSAIRDEGDHGRRETHDDDRHSQRNV